MRWFNDARGCGFISPQDGSKDCFVRGSAIAGFHTLAEGETVEFEVAQGANGPEAVSVTRVTGAARRG